MTRMIEENTVESGSDWGRFLKRHWLIFAVFIAAAIAAVVAAVYVFVWFTGNAQSTGLVPASLGAWTMNNLVLFILHAIFWELVLIGVPAAIGTFVGWLWWRRLPGQEKQEYHLSHKQSKTRNAGGAISSLMFIAFALKVYLDGNWNQIISTYSLNYFVNSLVTILIWATAIFAIPAAVGIAWWAFEEMNKNPQS